MKVLNLAYPEKSEVNFIVSKFPDGQQQVVINGGLSNGGWYNIEQCEIKSNLNNFSDLEKIVCAVKSLRGVGVKEIHLYVPYFMGSRSDRQFEHGSNNYLKDVICPIINSLNLEYVTVLDPHSDVLEACLNNFRKVDNLKLVLWALDHIKNHKQLSLISPDAGANKKIYSLGKKMGYAGEIFTCEKVRDASGEITKTKVPYLDLTKDMIIIDDICDGGRTFIEIAKVIREMLERFENLNGTPGNLYLIVTHGIFSKGFGELGKYFDGIFCTNSYMDVPEYDWDGDKKDIPTKVKQFNIF